MAIMEKLLEIKSKIFTFVQNNYLVVIVASVIFLLFIPIIIFSNLSPTPNNTTIQITPTQSIPTKISITNTPEITGNVHQEQTAKDSGIVYTLRSDDLETPSVKETLSDGSIKYTFDSLNPNRSDMIIAKNRAVIFMRYTVTGGKTISDGYKNLHGKQSHTLPGPTFYGPNTVIYYYEDGGTALTVDPKTGTTYEEFTFQPPISVEEFNQKYKQYIN